MTNWGLIGPSPMKSLFNAKSDTATSIGVLSLDKLSSGDGDIWREYDGSWDVTTNRLMITTTDETSVRVGYMQIGVGGGGDERVILELPGTIYGARNWRNLVLPITIRAGERVSIRVESTGAATLTVQLNGWNDPLFRTDLRYADLMGQASISALTVCDPGDTLHTKGAWAPLIDPTANDYKSLLIMLQNTTTYHNSNVEHLFDLGIGGSGSEIVVVENMYAKREERHMGILSNVGPVFYQIDAHIPAGVRLAGRCQADNTTLGQRNLVGMAVIGLY